VGPQLSSARPVLPGQPYAPPPPQAKLPPSDLTEYRLQQLLAGHEPGGQLWQALVADLKGMSPLLAREIAYCALGDTRATVAQVERLDPLLQVTAELLSPLESHRWQPTVVLEQDQPAVYAPYPVTHRGQPQPAPSVSQAVEAVISAGANADPYAGAKRPVGQALAEARTRLERRREALERSLDQAEEAGRLRQWGEWILAYAHTIVPGQTELLAEMAAGEPLRIPLDPDRSPSENARACFAAYRKAQRADIGGPARLEEVDLALRDLEQLQTDLDLAASRPDVDGVRAALVEGGYLSLSKRGRGAARTALSGPLAVPSPDGLEILVGRNSRQNDEVTFRRAQGDDWWFHVHGVPGAHVLVRAERQDLPPATIQRAAELAAYFSGLRGEAQVQVDFTRRRHVRRIPGAAPGLVTYSQEQTIRVAPRGPGEGL
jgi:predicted ribosome quality control (RQC) complex YloA/Tae2 family protein